MQSITDIPSEIYNRLRPAFLIDKQKEFRQEYTFRVA